MFAIAFDMTVAEMERLHPRSVRVGYDEIGRTLARYDFAWIQGSVYDCINEDLANLTKAMNALKGPPLLPGLCPRYPRLPRRAMVRLHQLYEILNP